MIEHFLTPEEKSGDQLNAAIRELQLEVSAIMKLLEKYTLIEKIQGQTVQSTTRPPSMRTPNEPFELMEGEVIDKLNNGQLKVKGERGGYLMSIEQYKMNYPRQAAEYLNSITEDHEEADQTEAEVHEEE